jgi:CHAD domain-containing protein
VHDWRICTRRVLALEALLAPRAVPARKGCSKLLHPAFHAAGELRDAQVAMRMLQSIRSRHPAAKRAAARLERSLPRLRREVTRTVRRVHTRELRSLAERWMRNRSDAQLRRSASLRVTAGIRSLREELRLSTRDPERALHRRRIRVKQLRYMLELFASNGHASPGMKAALGVVSRLQQSYGKITDLQMTLDIVERKHGKESRNTAMQLLQRHLLRQYQRLLRQQSRQQFVTNWTTNQ